MINMLNCFRRRDEHGEGRCRCKFGVVGKVGQDFELAVNDSG